jgi:putative nucleotidyltransferase with HDIG domain
LTRKVPSRVDDVVMTTTLVPMDPPVPLETVDDALALLASLGAPPRLVTHGRLVAEAAEELLFFCRSIGLVVDEGLVRAGAVLHDAGKCLYPSELEARGARHEEAGQELLLRKGVSPRVARCCVSHARWNAMPCTLEELLVALADTLWKGVRRPELESDVFDEVVRRTSADGWAMYLALDTTLEAIANSGPDRLLRSRT